MCFEQIHSALLDGSSPRAQVLLGPRQVGKTTLLRQLARRFLDDGWPPANLLDFDFQDDRYDRDQGLREVLASRPPGFRSDHPRLALLDEITHAPRWDLALKLAVDEAREQATHARTRLLATDSAAALMHRGARDSLQGRLDEHRMFGLTFLEALRLQGLEEEEEREVHLRSPGAFERYLSLGGLPEHVAAGNFVEVWDRTRRDVVHGAIARDLAREGVDVERVASLFRHMVQDSGGLFEPSSRAMDMQQEGEKGPDVRTVRRWTELLQQACLLDALEPWHPGLRHGTHKPSRALKLRRRIYASDHGYIPAFSPFANPMSRTQVRSRVFETVVFTHLRDLRERHEDYDLRYFREDEDAEIDFVLAYREDDIVLGLEVTASKNVDMKRAGIARAGRRAAVDAVLLIHGAPVAPRRSGPFAAWPLESFLLDPRGCLEGSLEWVRDSR